MEKLTVEKTKYGRRYNFFLMEATPIRRWWRLNLKKRQNFKLFSLLLFEGTFTSFFTEKRSHKTS
jgi:hypothetical protein